MKVLVVDRLSYAVASSRVYTDEGFLHVPGKAARTGIQQYLASELGLTDRNPNDVINVYRPADEVFHVDSLNSYQATDVTDNHPSDLVNAATFKDVSVGVVKGPGRQDGDFVVVDMIVKAADAIKAVESGKVELSAGYTAEYDHTPGVTADGTPYEFIQRNIRINHVALVDKARAGAQARLFDKSPESKTMKRVILDAANGVSVEVADDATATLISATIDGLHTALKTANTARDEAMEEKEKMEAEKDQMAEELEEEKKKSSDSAIADRLSVIAETKDAARKLAGDEFTCDSVDPVEIQRAALAAVRPSVPWADKSAVYVQAAWDHAVESGVTPDPVAAQRAQLAKDASAAIEDADATVTPRAQATADMSAAWKKTTGEA